MRISAAFPSTYLKAADLAGRRARVIMSHVNMEDLGGDLKPILFFQGKEKGLVLNKTNANAIATVYGDDTDQWTGQVVELYEAMVEFQGRTVAAIRVHVPRAQVAAPVKQQAVPQPQRNGVGHQQPSPSPIEHPVGTVLDDEIPF